MKTHDARFRHLTLLMAALGWGCGGDGGAREGGGGIVVPLDASDETVDEIGVRQWEVEAVGEGAFTIVGLGDAGIQVARVDSMATDEAITLTLTGPSDGTLVMNAAGDMIEGGLSSTVVLERYLADAGAEGFRGEAICPAAMTEAMNATQEFNMLMQAHTNAIKSMGDAAATAARNLRDGLGACAGATAGAGVACNTEQGQNTPTTSDTGADEAGESGGNGESGNGESGGGSGGSGGESGGGSGGSGGESGGGSGGYGESGYGEGGYGSGGYAQDDNAAPTYLAPLDPAWWSALPLTFGNDGEASTPFDASHWNLRD